MRTGEVQLFAGFLKCEDCGHAMSYSNSQGIPQYSCEHYRRHGKEACTCHYIRKDMLEQVVLDDIGREDCDFANSIMIQKPFGKMDLNQKSMDLKR